MKINAEVFEYASKLAKLKFSQADAAKEMENLKDIAVFVEGLKEIPDTLPEQTERREPGAKLREDVSGVPFERETLMENSSDNDGELFIVPQTI
ncbi:MAG: hypothetical protein IKU25_04520 [Clostridia bacterium]|nr:hypothetical protein [Clostridia bacterium]